MKKRKIFGLFYVYISEGTKEVSALDDSRIISLFWKRDESAISGFEAKYKRLCLMTARNITGDDGSAEECLSDLCLKLWNSIPPERPDSLKAYALKIIRNLALNVYRREHTSKRSAVFVELEDCEGELAVGHEASELPGLLNAFLGTLEPVEAKMFLNRYLLAKQVNEIAKSLGISPNKVSKILAKTRGRLKEYLTKEGVYI